MSESKKFERAAKSLEKLARQLDAIPVPFCVVGGMALHAYGYSRFTTDVDILTTEAGYVRLTEALVGNGYIFDEEKRGRIIDTEHNSPIDICISDGSARWPGLFGNVRDSDGIPVIKLAKLIDMKLSSARTEDLLDVAKLIEVRKLEPEFARSLDATNHERWYSLFS